MSAYDKAHIRSLSLKGFAFGDVENEESEDEAEDIDEIQNEMEVEIEENRPAPVCSMHDS